jgi:hypothetical protein
LFKIVPLALWFLDIHPIPKPKMPKKIEHLGIGDDTHIVSNKKVDTDVLGKLNKLSDIFEK